MNRKTDFFEKVYAVVKQIPYGRVSTYGAIANYLGSKKSWIYTKREKYFYRPRSRNKLERNIKLNST